jgi:hypothetical protein
MFWKATAQCDPFYYVILLETFGQMLNLGVTSGCDIEKRLLFRTERSAMRNLQIVKIVDL